MIRVHNNLMSNQTERSLLISKKDTLPSIPTQQGQTVYIGLPIYFTNLIRVQKIHFFKTKLI